MGINNIIKKFSTLVATGFTLATLSTSAQADCHTYSQKKDFCVNQDKTKYTYLLYNDQGLLEREIRDYDSQPVSTTWYEYNYQGNLILETLKTLNKKGDYETENVKKYLRTKNQVKVLVNRNPSNGKVDETFTYTYDNGEIVKITADYNNDGKTDEVIYQLKKKKVKVKPHTSSQTFPIISPQSSDQYHQQKSILPYLR